MIEVLGSLSKYVAFVLGKVLSALRKIMGYTRIVQFGNVTEIYQYEKNLTRKKSPHVSSLSRKRNLERRVELKRKGLLVRNKKNSRRAINAFFRLCHHNNCLAKSISFCTLTFAYDLTYKEACRHVARFMERIKNSFDQISVSYISVPELTEKGRHHFHLLIYDLPPEISRSERTTRNLQRLFERGYVDISLASFTSAGIAGYMAKYMAKALSNAKFGTTRVYNASRNIKKIYSAGGNTIDQYLNLIEPDDNVEKRERVEYDAPYLGKCRLNRTQTYI